MTDLPNIVDAIRACLPHAATDGTLPALCGVRLVSGQAQATDRYTLALADYDCEWMDDHDVFVSLATAKAILSAKSPASAIGLADNGRDATLRLVNGQTFTLPSMASVGDFPNIPRLVPEPLPVESPSPSLARIGLLMSNLVKFDGKHFPYRDVRSRKGHGLRFEFQESETKPVRVTVGAFPWFTGVLVPLRADWNR